ncbi:hypothetical protein GCK32_002668 [Trichostrongylus colubriformis]|uniref:G protein-coupled receptor n=1 Tax=Trichostrongylus colubriformis TaxID=6319 RepID=A0AAN8G054_TRICO
MNFLDFDPFIINCYYAVFVTAAVFINGLLIYLIEQRSPQIVRSLKAMLINICVTQIVIALMAGFFQGRMVANSATTAFLPVGPCRVFGPMTCYFSYNFINAFALYVELLIVQTMVHRYQMMKAGQMSTTGLLLTIAVVVILPALVMVSPYIYTPDFHIIMEETIREHPSLNIEKYGEFGGVPSLSDAVQAISSLISFATAITCPILTLYVRRLILNTFSNSYHYYTRETVHSSKMFLKGWWCLWRNPSLFWEVMGTKSVAPVRKRQLYVSKYETVSHPRKEVALLIGGLS